MFSTRTDWELSPNPFSLAWDQARQRHIPLWNLIRSNPMAVGLAYPEEAITSAIAPHTTTPYQPKSFGIHAARQALLHYGKARQWSPSITEEQIMLTASTSEAYAHIFRLLANPGDEILMPQPSYPLLDHLARVCDVTIKNYDLELYDGWSIDLPSLQDAISPQTRAIVIVSPNNPTGSCLNAEDLKSLVEICKEHQLALIADHVFSDYLIQPTPSAIPNLATSPLADEILWFAMEGLSKSMGMPGLKLAWTIVGGPKALRDEALARLEMIADTFLSVTMPVQSALPRLLEIAPDIQEQIQKRIQANLHLLQHQLQGESLSLLPIEGGWSAIIRYPEILDDQELAAKLIEEEGVIIYPASLFGFPSQGYLAISLLPSPTILKTGIAKLIRWLDRKMNLHESHT